MNPTHTNDTIEFDNQGYLHNELPPIPPPKPTRNSPIPSPNPSPTILTPPDAYLVPSRPTSTDDTYDGLNEIIGNGTNLNVYVEDESSGVSSSSPSHHDHEHRMRSIFDDYGQDEEEKTRQQLSQMDLVMTKL